MTAQELLEKYTKDNALVLSPRIENSHNLTHIATGSSGIKSIIKVNPSKEGKPLLQNELEWLTQTVFEDSEFKVPLLLNTEVTEDFLLLEMEYVPGRNFVELLNKEDYAGEVVQRLAKFCHWIETLLRIDTRRTQEKEKLSNEEWNKKFKEKLDNWKLAIEKLKPNPETLDLINHLSVIAHTFNVETVGFGGIHGSSKMQEFIVTDSDLYVVDWEVASSHYIQFYQTASIASYLLVRLQNSQAYQQFLQERESLLTDDLLEKFRKHFKPILAQRLVGDIFDLVTIDKKEVPTKIINEELGMWD